MFNGWEVLARNKSGHYNPLTVSSWEKLLPVLPISQLSQAKEKNVHSAASGFGLGNSIWKSKTLQRRTRNFNLFIYMHIFPFLNKMYQERFQL